MSAIESGRASNVLSFIALGFGAGAFGVALTAGILELNDTGTTGGAQYDRAAEFGLLAVFLTIIAVVVSGLSMAGGRSKLSIAALITAIGALPLAFLVYMVLLLADVCVPGSCRP